MYSYVKEYHRKGIFGDGRYSVEVRLALSWKIGAKKEKDHCLKCRQRIRIEPDRANEINSCQSELLIISFKIQHILSTPPPQLCDHQCLQGKSETIAKVFCRCLLFHMVVQNFFTIMTPSKKKNKKTDKNAIRSITGSKGTLHLSTYDLCSTIRKIPSSQHFLCFMVMY